METKTQVWKTWKHTHTHTALSSCCALFDTLIKHLKCFQDISLWAQLHLSVCVENRERSWEILSHQIKPPCCLHQHPLVFRCALHKHSASILQVLPQKHPCVTSTEPQWPCRTAYWAEVTFFKNIINLTDHKLLNGSV